MCQRYVRLESWHSLEGEGGMEQAKRVEWVQKKDHGIDGE
jgi:hypothetical protein